MEMFLKGLDHARNGLRRQGIDAFHPEQLVRFSSRYDKIIGEGYQANKNTKGRLGLQECIRQGDVLQ